MGDLTLNINQFSPPVSPWLSEEYIATLPSEYPPTPFGAGDGLLGPSRPQSPQHNNTRMGAIGGASRAPSEIPAGITPLVSRPPSQVTNQGQTDHLQVPGTPAFFYDGQSVPTTPQPSRASSPDGQPFAAPSLASRQSSLMPPPPSRHTSRRANGPFFYPAAASQPVGGGGADQGNSRKRARGSSQDEHGTRDQSTPPLTTREMQKRIRELEGELAAARLRLAQCEPWAVLGMQFMQQASRLPKPSGIGYHGV